MSATRRQILWMGAGGAALPVLGAAGSAMAQTGARTDAELLASIASIEQVSALMYDQAARRLAGDEPLARALALFADQEREHARVVVPALEAAGGDVPPAPTGPDAVPGLERALARGRGATLRFATTVEDAAIAAYYEAQGKLRDPELLRRTASTMACQAQHQVVLRQALGRDPLPDAFVTGRRR